MTPDELIEYIEDRLGELKEQVAQKASSRTLRVTNMKIRLACKLLSTRSRLAYEAAR